MATVYLETRFVSAIVSNRTDVKSLYRRQASLDWWESQRCLHDVYVSIVVVEELSAPTYPLRDKALDVVHEVSAFLLDDEIIAFGEVLVQERVMPGPLAGDAYHVAIACVRNIDYILSWNVRHLANPNKAAHLRTICMRAGYVAPEIITPDLLWETEMSDESREKTSSDPMIDEIRAIRKALSEAHGNDVRRLGQYLKEVQKNYAGRVAQPPKKAEASSQK